MPCHSRAATSLAPVARWSSRAGEEPGEGPRNQQLRVRGERSREWGERPSDTRVREEVAQLDIGPRDVMRNLLTSTRRKPNAFPRLVHGVDTAEQGERGHR